MLVFFLSHIFAECVTLSPLLLLHVLLQAPQLPPGASLVAHIRAHSGPNLEAGFVAHHLRRLRAWADSQRQLEEARAASQPACVHVCFA